MNPFLSDAVAVPRPDPGRRPWRSGRGRLAVASRCTARRLIRGAGALAFAAGLTLAPGAVGAVDLNTATAEQLQTVRGIGSKTAEIIIQERVRGGRFESLQDLSDRVRGIGPKRLQSLQAAGLTVTSKDSGNTSSAAGKAGRR